MKKRIVFVSLTLLFASSILTACNTNSVTPVSTPTASMSQFVERGTNTITVHSSEEITVVPDIAQVVYAVTTQTKDAAGCQEKNSKDVLTVVELLKSLSVEETSIQTSNYYMQPIYDYSNNTQKITGYQATTTLTVSDLPIDSLGDMLTKSVSAGINTVQSINYSSSKYDENYQEALKLAVASAKTKAQTLADAGTCTLGSVVSIQENSNYSQARYTNNSLTNKQVANGLATEEAAPMNIMPGEIKVSVDITVQYQIQ